MLIVSQNLAGIAQSFSICPPELVEEFSLKVVLHAVVRRMRDNVRDGHVVQYDVPFQVQDFFEEEERLTGDLVMLPKQNVLACSAHEYRMPAGYFGMIQTKGSLARLFVSATANDGQVEPGYRGRLTLELSNHATFPVSIRPGANIAQLFIFRCSSDADRLYAGRYQGAMGPTIPVF